MALSTYRWPEPGFPAGVRYYKAFLQALDGAGRPIAGTWQMELETPLVWAATGTTITNQINKRELRNGYCEFWVPFSDQAGFTAGKGGATISNFGVRFEFEPQRTTQMGTEVFVKVTAGDAATAWAALTAAERLALALPAATSNGIPIKVANLTNIGAWPNASSGTVQPPVTSTIAYTADASRPGLYSARITTGSTVTDPFGGRSAITTGADSRLPAAVEGTLATALAVGAPGGLAKLDAATGKVLDGAGQPVGTSNVTADTLPGIGATGAAVAKATDAAAARTALGIPALLAPLAPKASPAFTGTATGLTAAGVTGAIPASAVGTTIAPLVSGVVPDANLPKPDTASVYVNGTDFTYHGVIITARPNAWSVQLFSPSTVAAPAWLDPATDARFTYPTS